MARRVYIIAPGQPITPQVEAAAAAAGAKEIAQGIPLGLEREGVTGTFPFVYEEPDDPERAPMRNAVIVLLNQLNRPAGTQRTALQINNALDAISLILLRRVVRNEAES